MQQNLQWPRAFKKEPKVLWKKWSAYLQSYLKNKKSYQAPNRKKKKKKKNYQAPNISPPWPSTHFSQAPGPLANPAPEGPPTHRPRSFKTQPDAPAFARAQPKQLE